MARQWARTNIVQAQGSHEDDGRRVNHDRHPPECAEEEQDRQAEAHAIAKPNLNDVVGMAIFRRQITPEKPKTGNGQASAKLSMLIRLLFRLYRRNSKAQ